MKIWCDLQGKDVTEEHCATNCADESHRAVCWLKYGVSPALEKDLPKTQDLRGLAKGMTDGLSSEEYVRKIRDDGVMDMTYDELSRESLFDDRDDDWD